MILLPALLYHFFKNIGETAMTQNTQNITFYYNNVIPQPMTAQNTPTDTILGSSIEADIVALKFDDMGNNNVRKLFSNYDVYDVRSEPPIIKLGFNTSTKERLSSTKVIFNNDSFKDMNATWYTAFATLNRKIAVCCGNGTDLLTQQINAQMLENFAKNSQLALVIFCNFAKVTLEKSASNEPTGKLVKNGNIFTYTPANTLSSLTVQNIGPQIAEAKSEVGKGENIPFPWKQALLVLLVIVVIVLVMVLLHSYFPMMAIPFIGA